MAVQTFKTLAVHKIKHYLPEHGGGSLPVTVWCVQVLLNCCYICTSFKFYLVLSEHSSSKSREI